jgi:hypothetical protein
VAQGLYFLVTGIWPMVHMRSFLAVTGPKRDLWLVNTVGAVVAAVGGTLLLAGLRRRPTAETAVLGLGSAAALAGVDVVYVARRTISPVYLLDAMAEGAFIAAWGVLSLLGRRR